MRNSTPAGACSRMSSSPPSWECGEGTTACSCFPFPLTTSGEIGCDGLFARVTVSATAFSNNFDRQEGAVSQTCPVRSRSAAVPPRRGHLAGAAARAPPALSRLPMPVPAPAAAWRGCWAPAPARPFLPVPPVSARSRCGSRCPPRRPSSPASPEPPARLASSKLRWCRAAPSPPRLLKKAVFCCGGGFFFFLVVGERKSASSKISEVQVHQIFLPAACYTLRESDCRAPGALLAVRGCSCFPLRGKSTSGICSRFQRFLPRLL